MNRKILIVGMLDSIHLARWLKQFQSAGIEFWLYPSKKYRKINSELSLLMKSQCQSTYRIAYSFLGRPLSGYTHFFLFSFFSRITKFNLRAILLLRLIKKIDFKIIHAIELQGAGYLFLELPHERMSSFKSIITNWGSDISFYCHYAEHATKIRKVLGRFKYYSAECQRDYALAIEMGFQGTFLPCIPNAGGFEIPDSMKYVNKPSDRLQITIKAYGGQFGRPDLIIPLVKFILKEFPQYKLLFYSTTSDVISEIVKLNLHANDKVRIVTVKERLSHALLMKEFSRSRLYIGCSRSDGISTSFLEAIVHGAYPIQTNSSCANEWLSKGFSGAVVDSDLSIIQEAVRKALSDDNLVNEAFLNNHNLAKMHLSRERIEPLANLFYEI